MRFSYAYEALMDMYSTVALGDEAVRVEETSKSNDCAVSDEKIEKEKVDETPDRKKNPRSFREHPDIRHHGMSVLLVTTSKRTHRTNGPPRSISCLLKIAEVENYPLFSQTKM